jgi:hypothetical protein
MNERGCSYPDEGGKEKADAEIHDRFDHASEIPNSTNQFGATQKIVQLVGADARPNKGKKRAAVTGSRRIAGFVFIS